jgi:hypothetical protein
MTATSADGRADFGQACIWGRVESSSDSQSHGTRDIRGSVCSGGFALTEVLVALLLAVVMTTGVAALSGVAVKAAWSARMQTSAVALAEERMEQLRALTWTGGQAGAPRLADTRTDLSVVPPGLGGPGLSTSPSAALDANTPGYVDYLAADGRWVATGLQPPPNATFIRRWSVQQAPHDPVDTVVLRVFVTTVTSEAQRRNRGGTGPRSTDSVLLSTIKTRKVR